MWRPLHLPPGALATCMGMHATIWHVRSVSPMIGAPGSAAFNAFDRAPILLPTILPALIRKSFL